MKFFFLCLFLFHSSLLLAGEVVIGRSFKIPNKEFTMQSIDTPTRTINMPNPNLSHEFVAIKEEDGRVRVLIRDGSVNLGIYTIDYATYEEAFLAKLVKNISVGLTRSNNLVGKDDGCTVQQDTTDKKIDSPALQGARKVLANFFQSCSALEEKLTEETPNLSGVTTKKPTNTDKKSAPGIKNVRHVTSTDKLNETNIFMLKATEAGDYPGPNCKDMRDTPPVYAWGGKAHHDKESGKLDLFRNRTGVTGSSKDKSVSIDCSGFIAAAMANMGLKIDSEQTGYQVFGTSTLKEASEKENSCLPSATIEPSDIIRPGDIYNHSGSHVIMIDEIGEDPLAVERFAKIGECNDISVEDFNFTYIHSGAIKGSYGPSRVHISTHANGSDSMMSNLRSLAVKMCQSKVDGNEIRQKSSEVFSSKKFSIMRHDSEREDCYHDPVPLEGEECLKDCPHIYQQTGVDITG